MSERFTGLRGWMRLAGFLLILLGATMGSGELALAQDDGSRTFEPKWFLVRLEAPLELTESESPLPPRTGRAELDVAIEQARVDSIDLALSLEGRTPANPDAFKRYGLDRTYRFAVPEGSDIRHLVKRFARLPGVELAEPDYLVRAATSDPLFPDQWALDTPADVDVDAPEAWQISVGGDVILGIVDTGIDVDHPDLASKLEPGRDFVNGDLDPDDDHGHGTAVASIASALTDNGTGIAGACWNCRLLPVKVLDSQGWGPTSTVTDGIVWAVDQGARVINLSLGYQADDNPSGMLLSGLLYAYDAGVVVVSATGNSGANAVEHPARYIESLAIGATDAADQRRASSTFGPQIDAVAPGDDVIAATIGGGYQYRSGTSVAVPHVTGLIGLLQTVHPSVGREEARHLIRTGAEDEVGNPVEDIPGYDLYHGWGRLNMHRALEAAQSSTTLRVEGKTATRVYFDSPNPLASSYDFVRGDLTSLRESWSGVDLGSVVCLENNSPDPDTSGDEDTGTPEPGQGFFYIGRFNGAAGAGSYGGSSRHRDRVVAPTVHSLAWTLESNQANASFGTSVAGAGDVNGDGYDDVIVGADQYENGQAGEGAAFVYLGSPDGLESVPVWLAEGNQAGAAFGWSVAAAGDVNGDGYDDVIVSALYHDNGQTNEGRAYVYLGNSNGLDATADWVAESNQAWALFGWVVRPAGDINGDGYADVAVVAILYDNGQTDEGKVFIYTGSASGLSSSPTWSFEPNQAQAYLSGSGAVGDVDGDGFDDFVVGANEYNGFEVDEGRAWLFHGSAVGLSSGPAAILQLDVPGAWFGYATSGAGDVNCDGYDDVIVSALAYTDGAETGEGGVFAYLGSPGGLVTSPAWSFQSDQADAFLGWSAGTAGDVNGDGCDDVIVSTESYDVTRTDQGGAWVFFGSPSGISNAPDWTGSGSQPDARYGLGAAGAGDVNGDGLADVIVGARGYDNGEVNEGRALVYHGPLAAATTSDCPAE